MKKLYLFLLLIFSSKFCVSEIYDISFYEDKNNNMHARVILFNTLLTVGWKPARWHQVIKYVYYIPLDSATNKIHVRCNDAYVTISENAIQCRKIKEGDEFADGDYQELFDGRAFFNAVDSSEKPILISCVAPYAIENRNPKTIKHLIKSLHDPADQAPSSKRKNLIKISGNSDLQSLSEMVKYFGKKKGPKERGAIAERVLNALMKFYGCKILYSKVNAQDNGNDGMYISSDEKLFIVAESKCHEKGATINSIFKHDLSTPELARKLGALYRSGNAALKDAAEEWLMFLQHPAKHVYSLAFRLLKNGKSHRELKKQNKIALLTHLNAKIIPINLSSRQKIFFNQLQILVSDTVDLKGDCGNQELLTQCMKKLLAKACPTVDVKGIILRDISKSVAYEIKEKLALDVLHRVGVGLPALEQIALVFAEEDDSKSIVKVLPSPQDPSSTSTTQSEILLDTSDSDDETSTQIISYGPAYLDHSSDSDDDSMRPWERAFVRGFNRDLSDSDISSDSENESSSSDSDSDSESD